MVDLGWVTLSPYVALLVRDNFVFYEPHWDAIRPYWGFTIAAGAAVFTALRPHKTLYRYTSLSDVLRIFGAVTLMIFLAVSLSFVSSRLEGVARSIPVIQWLILIGGLVWTRVFARIWYTFRNRPEAVQKQHAAEHVLIIGVSHLTELYLESLAEYAPKRLEVVGILAQQHLLYGRRLRDQMVLGTPENLSQVLEQLELHGIEVSRIAVTDPIQRLSPSARSAILALERNSDMKVDWLPERLGLTDKGSKEEVHRSDPDPGEEELDRKAPRNRQRSRIEPLALGRYGYVKRASDILLATVLTITLAPLLGTIALLIIIDLGLPIVFWQKRPGRSGRPFKLYKFRTMRPPHDREGTRIPDEDRSSGVGRLLRRMRLDELPQLYNILIGEMSFVGPRPLLPRDEPDDPLSRLSVRPGLTGLAQVHGYREMSPNDKNALDIWYIRNASPWLDAKIALGTALVFARGERLNIKMLQSAREAIENLKKQNAAPLTSSGLRNAVVELARSAG
jgi:lipopolysaccharide/colanic/teichoic acid biosynthesis glycosyltransferase